MKNIIPSTITAILLFLFSIVGAFFLLVALNGYSESDTSMGLIIFAIWAIFTIALFSVGSGLAVRFIKTKMEHISQWIIVTRVVIVCTIFGSISIAIAVFIGIFFTEISRTSF